MLIYTKFLVGKKFFGHTSVIGKSHRHKYHSKQSFTRYHWAELHESVHRQTNPHLHPSRDAECQIDCRCRWHGLVPGTKAVRDWRHLFPTPWNITSSNGAREGNQENTVPLWIPLPVTYCEHISLTFLLQPSPLVPGRDNFHLYQTAHYCDNLNKH